MSGRSLLRELFELMLDTSLDVPAFGTINLPVELAPAGNRHAFYVKSVLLDEEEPFLQPVGEFGVTNTLIQYGMGQATVGGQRLTFLVITNGSGIPTLVHARVYKFVGLADT